MKNYDKKKNMGFSLVELIIGLVILTIIAAIAIPVTLSIIDSSNDIDINKDAKSIWDAIQTGFQDQLANDRHWLSTKERNDNNKSQGMILDQYDKNYGKDRKETDRDAGAYQLEDFENKSCFLYIGYTYLADSIKNKIETSKELEMLYAGAGKYSEYFDSDTPEYPYNLYVIVFKYVNDKTVYYYDGKTISDEWIFSSPKSVTSVTGSEKELLFEKGKKTIKLQMYCLINKKTGFSEKSPKPGTNFKNMVKGL